MPTPTTMSEKMIGSCMPVARTQSRQGQTVVLQKVNRREKYFDGEEGRARLLPRRVHAAGSASPKREPPEHRPRKVPRRILAAIAPRSPDHLCRGLFDRRRRWPEVGVGIVRPEASRAHSESGIRDQRLEMCREDSRPPRRSADRSVRKVGAATRRLPDQEQRRDPTVVKLPGATELLDYDLPTTAKNSEESSAWLVVYLGWS